jgi:DNA-binding transcriptional ArsR family regulator
MNSRKSASLAEIHVDAFNALADPTRRRIVESLQSGERQVSEIVEHAGVHQSGVSRHLRILHDAGFVSVRPDQQRRLYSLRQEPFVELEGWLANFRGLWEARLDRFEVALKERVAAGRTKPEEPQ